jgi:hypothetical protein
VCVCPVQKFFHLFSLISIPLLLLLLLSKNITYVMISSYTVSLSILVPWGLRGVKEHKPPAIFTFRESGQFFLTADTGHDQTNLSLDCREIICKCQSTTQPTTFIFYYWLGDRKSFGRVVTGIKNKIPEKREREGNLLGKQISLILFFCYPNNNKRVSAGGECRVLHM